MWLLLTGVGALAVSSASFGALVTDPGEGRASALLRQVLFGWALLVATQAALGSCGWLTPGATVAALCGCAFSLAAAARRFNRKHPETTGGGGGWTALEAVCLGALAFGTVERFLLGHGGRRELYDVISYHLYIPAAWMHSRRLEIVPTLFGDLAPGYSPSNAELSYHFLLSTLGSAFLPLHGQALFAATALLAIYTLVREEGGTSRCGLLAALGFLLVPEVWHQAGSAMVDVAVAGHFICCVHYLRRISRALNRGSAAGLALSLGLLLGTKFAAVAYLVPLASLGAFGAWGWRKRPPSVNRPWLLSISVVLTVLAAGGFWYVRNLLATGNPMFPVEVKLLGVPLFPGIYDVDTMRAWVYHFPVSEISVLGRWLIAPGWGFSAAAVVAFAARWRHFEVWTALVFTAVLWLVVPYQSSRFLFPVYALAAVSVGLAAARLGLWEGPLLAALTAGSLVQFPSWDRASIVTGGLVGAGVAPLRPRLRVGLIAGAAIAVIAAAGLGSARFREAPPNYRIRDDLDDAWAWVWENVRSSRIAYTGVNLPFPLYGWELSNEVKYANVFLGPEARVHDFPPLLKPPNPEAPVYRQREDFNAWLANLQALRIDVLFVAALYGETQITVRYDSEGFPSERAWADQHPELFPPIYSNEFVRIYRVKRALGSRDKGLGMAPR